MNPVVTLLDESDTSIVVVGASDDLTKFGARIYRNLKGKGYRVFAVNPRSSTVDGDPCYPTVGDLPVRPTIVDLVIPPAHALSVLQQCKDLGLDTVWVQPGAESAEVVDYLEGNNFRFVVDDCIMVWAKARGRAAG
jgi:predicted CoA-binding protein